MAKLPDNPLVSELFKAVHGKKDKKGKADLLSQHKRDDVKALLIWNFDKQIRSAIQKVKYLTKRMRHLSTLVDIHVLFMSGELFTIM